MMKEEHILKATLGTRNHFQVPEGYFDELASKVMASIPESQPVVEMQVEHISQRARILPLWQNAMLRKVAAVACVVLLLGGVSVGVGTSLSSRNDAQHVFGQNYTPVAQTEDSSFDEAADYTMLDNQEIYASLLSESADF